MEPLFKINDLNITFKTSYGSLHAVRGVNLHIDPSEIVGIVGESGSGKSQTLLAALGLTDSKTEIKGNVTLDNIDLFSLSSKEMRTVRHKKVGIIFQNPMTSLNPYIKVGTQLLEPLLGKALAKTDKIDLICDWLEKVYVSDPHKRLKMYAHEFSGGLQQRLMIVMALIHEPILLIADEPTTALDVTIQLEVLHIIKKIQSNIKTAVAFVSHDMGVIANMAHRIYVMYGGIMVETGTKVEILKNPLHPYTRSLIRSAKDVEDYDQSHSLYTIPGSPPNLLHMRENICPFYDRCFLRKDKCKEVLPPREQISNTHVRYCFASQEEVRELEL